MDLLGLHELQEDEEGDNDLLPAFPRLQKGPEVGVGVSLEVGADVEHFGVDADFLALDLAEAAADGVPAALFSAKDLAENLLQALEVCPLEKFVVIDGGLIVEDFLRELLLAEIAHSGLLAVDRKFFREIFVHLVFHQAAHEFLAGVALFLAGLLILLAGEEHAALDVQEGRRHDQKFAGHIQVLAVHLVDVFQVLVGDLDDGDIVDVDLVFFDQVHEQVQGALKHREFYRNSHSFDFIAAGAAGGERSTCTCPSMRRAQERERLCPRSLRPGLRLIEGVFTNQSQSSKHYSMKWEICIPSWYFFWRFFPVCFGGRCRGKGVTEGQAPCHTAVTRCLSLCHTLCRTAPLPHPLSHPAPVTLPLPLLSLST